MKAKTTKTKTGKRNTGMFYAILKNLPEYQEALKERKDKDALRQECKEIEVADFLKAKYGENGCYSGSLTALSDEDYSELLSSLEDRVLRGVTKRQLMDKINRSHFISLIFKKLTEIGVTVHKGYYEESNKVLSGLPIMKGYNLTTVPLNRLPDVFSAVCSYCDNIAAKQAKEAKARVKETELAKRN